MLTSQNITLSVDSNTALLFENAPEYKKKSLNFLLSEWLKEDPNKDSLSKIMDKAGFQALANGMTEDDLQKIINEV